MALPALIVAAIARIRAANNNAYDAVNNPAGLGQGGQRQNFIPDINAVADIGVFAAECVDKADADVALTHADVLLTRQDASNTSLDRIATAQSVLDAAGKIGLAAAEVDKAKAEVVNAKAEVVNAKTEVGRAKAEADRAQGYAAGLNLPAVTQAMAGRFLKVNDGGTAYELGEVTIATAADIKSGAGTGFVNAKTLGPILKSVGPGPGDLMESFRLSGTGSADWIECNGAVLSKATYSDLYAAIGDSYLDFLDIAEGTAPYIANTPVFAYVDGLVFMGVANTLGSSIVKLYRSTNDGLSFSACPGTQDADLSPNYFFKFKGAYVFVPYVLHSTSSGNRLRYTISTNGGASFSNGIIYDEQNTTNLKAAADANYIYVIAGTLLYRKGDTGPNQFERVGNPTGLSSTCIGLAAGNGALISCAANGVVLRSTDSGSSFTSNNLSSIFANSADVAFVNGKFYLHGLAVGNAAYVVLTSTEGANWTELLRSPNPIQKISFDGSRLLFLIANRLNAYDEPTKTFYQLAFVPSNPGQLVNNSDLFRAPDGLVVNRRPGGVAGIQRAKFAANKDTEFQVPNLPATTSRAKRYIRGRA